MNEILASGSPDAPPKTSTPRDTGEGLRSWARSKWRELFDGERAKSEEELRAKTRAQIEALDRDRLAQESEKGIPRIVRDLTQVRRDILKSSVSKPEEHAMLRLRDPRGNIHDIVYDPQKNPKPAFSAVLSWYSVGFAPIGSMNGYNTQFVTRAISQKDQSVIETWEVLGIKFPVKTPQFQILDEERASALKEIARIQLSQKAAAQELSLLTAPQKPQKWKARIARTRRIGELQSRLDSDDKMLAIQQSTIERTTRAIAPISPKYRDIAYTPYAASLNTPEVRASAVRYLKSSIEQTWSEERRANYVIKGVGSPEWTKWLEVKRAIDPRIGIALAMVERMDFVPYLKSYNPKDQSWELKPMIEVSGLMLEQLTRALTTLGLNREQTYTYQRNARTQAAGIAQITPKGQGHILSRYGSSLLPAEDFTPDHTVGPADAIQSLRFMQVHLIDQIEVQFPSATVKSQWPRVMANESTKLGTYGLLAAGYNGTMSRVVKEALGKWAGKQSPDAIYEKLKLENVIKNVGNNMETLTYVIKFAFVWRYLETNYPQEFAAPQVPKPIK